MYECEQEQEQEEFYIPYEIEAMSSMKELVSLVLNIQPKPQQSVLLQEFETAVKELRKVRLGALAVKISDLRKKLNWRCEVFDCVLVFLVGTKVVSLVENNKIYWHCIRR